MRCHEARKKIEALGAGIDKISEYPELAEHIRDCAECASMIQAEQLLKRDLGAMSEDDTTEIVPFAILKSRVEAMAGDASGRNDRPSDNTQEKGIMAKLLAKPQFSISIAVVVIVLLVATLVPLKFDEKLGYEVAIAGVDKDLALDEDKICELLMAIGIEDCNFEVGDCDELCNVKILGLTDEDQVQIVCAAFDELENCEVGNVYVINEDGDITIPDDINNMIIELMGDSASPVKVMVKGCLIELDDANFGDFGIWISANGDDSIIHTIALSDSMQNFVIEGSGMIMIDDDGNIISHEGADALLKTVQIIREESADGEAIVIDINGESITIDPNDPASLAQLEGLGFEVINLDGDGDSEHKMMFIKKDCIVVDEEDTDGGETAAKSSTDALPTDFELKQNYPNPFNPTTTIVYSLPQAEQVSLEVFNVNGQKVRTLIDGFVEAGDHLIVWDSKDDNNKKVASGVYLYKLTAGEYSSSQKMTLMK